MVVIKVDFEARDICMGKVGKCFRDLWLVLCWAGEGRRRDCRDACRCRETRYADTVEHWCWWRWSRWWHRDELASAVIWDLAPHRPEYSHRITPLAPALPLVSAH